MVAECFKKVIEYITMTAEVWFSFGGTSFRTPKGV